MQKGLTLKNLKIFTGMEDYEENNSIPDDKFYFAQNARFAGKVASSKLGNQMLGTALTSGTKFRGMFEYQYFDGSTLNKKLIGLYNKTFYEFNSTTQLWNSITTVWPNLQDLDVSAIPAANALYVVGNTNKTGNGTGKIFSGIDFVFTVSGVSVTPDNNTVYAQAGSQYVVIASSIVAGSGTITMKKQISTIDPTATGVLTKTGGGTVGDATLNYTVYSKASTATTTFTVIANSPEGVGIEYFAERLFIIGDPSFTGSIIAGQPTTSPATYYKIENFNTTTGATYFSAAKFNSLVAIKVINNSLYYWSTENISQHTKEQVASGDNPAELSRTGGATNQKSTTVIENDVWFVSLSSKVTVRSLGNEKNLGDNPRTKAISEIIKRTMDLLDLPPNQNNPVMTYFNRVVKIHLKTKDSPTNNITLVFDYNTGGWSVDRGQGVTVACIWNGQLVYGEDATGQAFKDEVGFTANGAAYAYLVKTGFKDDARPDTWKRGRYIFFKGKQSYYQAITIYLYRDGDYDSYSTYTIPSPFARGVSVGNIVNDGQWGSAEQGNAEWGGSTLSYDGDIALYKTEYLISIDRRSNLFAIGVGAEINGGKVITEQLELKYIPDNENYKRSNI